MSVKFPVHITLAVGLILSGVQNLTAEDNAIENSSPTASEAPIATAAPIQVKRNPFAEEAWSLVDDQKELWTSLKRMRFSDATWLVPLSGVMAGLFVTDNDTSKHISKNPTTLSHYDRASQVGVAALAGSAGAMWLFSHVHSNDQWRETGLLSARAVLNSLAITETLKYSFRRERPGEGSGQGQFFQGTGSFPSAHSTIAWSIAGAIGDEYPKPLPRILAYGAAAMVSYSRVHAGQHFSTDVAVGGLIGQLVAHQIYSRHHDPLLSPAQNNSFIENTRELSAEPSIANMGSPYVPHDSWVYPAIDRLASMGVIDTGFAGMRPWTRRECARLISEAEGKLGDMNSDASKIYWELDKEFSSELDEPSGAVKAKVESVYVRALNISGPPLTDGYYFGQTEINDYGRPFGQGLSSIAGISAYSTGGPWFGYVRAELQTAPSRPGIPPAASQFIKDFDQLPSGPPSVSSPAIQQVKILEAYVGLTLSNWQFSFGPQSLYWGPGDGGAMMFSDNAAPINMFRINRATPLSIPLVSQFLGPARMEFFFGQLSGHHFVGEPNFNVIGNFNQTLRSQPYIHGERFSFKPTKNFEFGFSATTIMGGPGVPLTLGTFKNSLFGGLRNGLPGSPQDPGDRRSGMDWSYRLPRLRNWLTFYGDSFTDDEYSPIAYWDRSASRAGLFLSHFPHIPKLDFRAEGVYTDLPVGGKIGRGFFYFNTRFKDGYTNDGSLIGSWIGRDGKGGQAWLNYWMNAKNDVEFSFRHQKVSQLFDPGGGTLTDFGVRSEFWTRPQWEISTGVQYETWNFPILKSGMQTNFSTSVQITFHPKASFRLGATE